MVSIKSLEHLTPVGRFRSAFAVDITVPAWQSRPILERLRRALELVRRRTLPQGLLGQAIDYALKCWSALTQFVEDGTLEIDNNLIENAIRPSALGKKNWLFVGHPEAGERSAVIYPPTGQLPAARPQPI